MQFPERAKKWMQDTERQLGREPSNYPDRVEKWLSGCQAEITAKPTPKEA